eukprot:tig00000144_g9177.t1
MFAGSALSAASSAPARLEHPRMSGETRGALGNLINVAYKHNPTSGPADRTCNGDRSACGCPELPGTSPLPEAFAEDCILFDLELESFSLESTTADWSECMLTPRKHGSGTAGDQKAPGEGGRSSAAGAGALKARPTRAAPLGDRERQLMESPLADDDRDSDCSDLDRSAGAFDWAPLGPGPLALAPHGHVRRSRPIPIPRNPIRPAVWRARSSFTPSG